MIENRPYRKLALLKTKFPDFENKVEHSYMQDPDFREISNEYLECIRKQELDIGTIGNRYDCYADTIKELKEELLSYLQKDSFEQA